MSETFTLATCKRCNACQLVSPEHLLKWYQWHQCNLEPYKEMFENVVKRREEQEKTA
jgi:hypothetical protein